MIKTALNDTYLGGTTPTALQKEVSTCQNMYYDRETSVMVNQSVKKFYTQFLFKIDTISQDAALPLEISATLFNKLSHKVREF